VSEGLLDGCGCTELGCTQLLDGLAFAPRVKGEFLARVSGRALAPGRGAAMKGDLRWSVGPPWSGRLIRRRWRRVNAPELVALVRAGAKFVNGRLVERSDREDAA
jgi:hypothetical protein